MAKSWLISSLAGVGGVMLFVTVAAAATPPLAPATVTGATLVADRAGCINGTGSLATCDPYGNNPGRGSSEQAEAWYLGGLVNDQFIRDNASTVYGEKQETPDTQQSGSITAGVGNYVVFKVGNSADLIWYYYKATQNVVSFSGWNTAGAATALSHVGVITPLPAALFLMLSAIGGLFGLKWFRRRPEDEALTA